MTTVARSLDSRAEFLARWLKIRWAGVLFSLALPLGLFARVWPSRDLPFWFDEVFTGVIASTPNVRALLGWCLSELTGPAYYGPIWAWEKVAGNGDLALRMPSLAMAIATPVLIAWQGHRDRRLALLWATIVVLWLPAMPDAFEARGYPQLFLLGCVQAIAFIAALRAPTIRTAFGWTTATALAALTHYYVLVPGTVQGVMLVAVHRRRALACWPALAAFVALAGWMLEHLPFLLRFGAHQNASYAPLPLSVLAIAPMLAFGAGSQGYIVLGAISAGMLKHGDPVDKAGLPERLLVWSGLIGFLLIFALGFVRPSFAPRYLTPTMPALLFGIALWVRRLPPARWFLGAIVIGAMAFALTAALLFGSIDPRYRERTGFVTEAASAWLMEARPARLVFGWTTPTGDASPPKRLAEVAGFFFVRAGYPVDVSVERGGAAAMSRRLAAPPPGRTAVLWVADIRGAAPRPARADRGWVCRDFGRDGVLVYACRSRG